MTTAGNGPTEQEEQFGALQRLDEEAQIIRTDPSGLAALNRSEVDAQLDAAHRYPRSFAKFVREAQTIAITSREVAKSCMYTLKRKNADGSTKNIVGPSVRLAEIVASTYGNLHAGARPVEVDETTVTCQGVCWDVERNVRVVTEVKRRITTSSGHRYGEDMIILTQNACSSIALRNAIFRVVPRALIDQIFARVREVASGDQKPMPVKRAEIQAACERLGVSLDRMLATVERDRLEDVTIDDIEALIGLGTRVKGGESIDDLFAKVMTVVETIQGTRTPLKKPAATPSQAPKPEDAISTPAAAAAKEPETQAEDPDAADRKAAEPTAEEIAAHEAAQRAEAESKQTKLPTGKNQRAPWRKQ